MVMSIYNTDRYYIYWLFVPITNIYKACFIVRKRFNPLRSVGDASDPVTFAVSCTVPELLLLISLQTTEHQFTETDQC